MLKKVVVAVAVLVMSTLTAVHCCTVFTASVGDTVLFGNNEDWPDEDTRIWFIPATETEHGGVYFGFDDYYAQGGMNDQGLCFDATAIPELVMKPHPEKLRTINFGQRVLETCATVEEVAEFVEKHDLSGLSKAQFLFADRMGGSVIVCPGTDGEVKTIQKEGIYQVITNFNVTYPQLGGYPSWRYNAAVRRLKEIENEEDLTVDYFESILKDVFQRITTYSTIYDSTHTIVYLYNQHNFDEVVIFNLKDELEKGYHTYHIPLLFQKESDPSEDGEEILEDIPEEVPEDIPEEESPDPQPAPVDPQSMSPPAEPPVTLFSAILIIIFILVVIKLLEKKKDLTAKHSNEYNKG